MLNNLLQTIFSFKIFLNNFDEKNGLELLNHNQPLKTCLALIGVVSLNRIARVNSLLELPTFFD